MHGETLQGQGQDALVGFVVVQAWRCWLAFPLANICNSWCVVARLRRHQADGQWGCVDHKLMAAVALATPIELGPQWYFRSAEVAGQEFLSLTSAAELWIYSGTMRSVVLPGSEALQRRRGPLL
eukprot:6476441-Lingulodinium_polyedra.AAC.1